MDLVLLEIMHMLLLIMEVYRSSIYQILLFLVSLENTLDLLYVE